MSIQQLDPQKLTRGYGIRCSALPSWPGFEQPPLEMAWCVVEPGEKARIHKHHECEAFVIVKGSGKLTIDGKPQTVGPADVVFIEPFALHELTNTGREVLLYLALVFEDSAQIARGMAAMDRAETTRPHVLITATPPTPNGDLHVGHLSGPYLAADVYNRYLRMRGVDSKLITGVDDHQSYTLRKAGQKGMTPEQTADELGDQIAGTLERTTICMDHYARPRTSPYHRSLVQQFFRQMVERGHIVLRDAETLYCEHCSRYLFEAWVSGSCPHCDAPSDGNACEACARPNDGVDLRDPHCNLCGSAPTTRKLERFYFPLAPFAERLRKFVDRTPMNAHMRALCLRMLDHGLPEIAVSQQSDWGIRVPVAGYEDQAIYAWFEMAPGYLAATQEMQCVAGEAPDFQKMWKSPACEIVQFFGFDNGYFHALLFPAILLAMDEDHLPPTTFVVNEFYLYEGAKFSSSRNHAMWGRELLEKVPVDVARFYLAYNRPEAEQTNFRFEDLERVIERELTQGWVPWLFEAEKRVNAEYEGNAPSPGAWTDEHQAFLHTVLRLSSDLAQSFSASTFSLQRTSRLLCELVRSGREFGKSQDPWHGVPGHTEERRTAVALELLALRTLALAAAPVMPHFAQALFEELGGEGPVGAQPWPEWAHFVAHGTKVTGLTRAIETIDIQTTGRGNYK